MLPEEGLFLLPKICVRIRFETEPAYQLHVMDGGIIVNCYFLLQFLINRISFLPFLYALTSITRNILKAPLCLVLSPEFAYVSNDLQRPWRQLISLS